MRSFNDCRRRAALGRSLGVGTDRLGLHRRPERGDEIRDAMAAGKTAAILYAGGTEQNGPHMSLAKHNLIARHVAGQIAERLGNALVYPVMPFSPAGDATEKTGHMRFPGTVSLSSEVFLGVMRQVAQSAVAAGFKQVYLDG